MIPSPYLYGRVCREKGRVFNGLTREILEVDPALLELTPAGVRWRLEHLRPEEISLLRENKFLFPDAGAAQRALTEYLRGLFQPGATLGVTLTLTYFCNLRCRYCAHGKLIDRREFMSPAVARQTIRWLEEMMARWATRHLRVTFYGGEPLLHFPLLDFLATELRELCRRQGVSYTFDLFTNGTLLTRERASRLRALEVTTVTVTVDGPREVHDRRRPYKSGGGTFDHILRNLHAALEEGLEVCLGTNLDCQTPAQVEELIRALTEAGVARRVSFSFGRTSPSLDNREFFTEVPELSTREFQRLWVLSQDLISRYGLRHAKNPARFLMYGFCDFWAPTTYVVMPSGRLTKCLGYMEVPEMVLGEVSGGAPRLPYDPAAVARDPLAIFAPPCRECFLLPHCFGGCLFEARLRGLQARQLPFCQKELILRGLDLVLEGLDADADPGTGEGLG